MEVKFYFADWSVTMFGDDEVGDVFPLGIGVVVRFPVNECDDVGVLFDAPRFTQVGKLRYL